MPPSLLLLAPLPAAALGALVASKHGVPLLAFAPSAVAAALGALVAFSLGGRRLPRHAPWLAALLVAASLAAPGIDGVHRWISLGPLRLNASAVFAPWLLVGVRSLPARPWRTALLLLLAQAVHVAQPDAAQASALAAGAAPLLLSDPPGRRLGALLSAALVALAVAAWSAPDPLPALDHVERILWMASSLGWPWAAALLASLLLLPAALWAAAPPGERPLALAFSLYLAAAFVSTFVGHFPVHIAGAGAGPILGWYAMLGLLRRRSESIAPPAPPGTVPSRRVP